MSHGFKRIRSLILALHKRVTAAQNGLRAGAWQTVLTESLAGKALGVVGLGHLGKRVARIGLAFGMDVTAWSPNLTDERAALAGVRRVSKEALFSEADVVSLHLVLGAGTAGLVSAATLSTMKPSAFLINTARAGLVDEEALIKALEQGRIAGAGLDVFSQEPLPTDHVLRRLDNVVLTPHLGYVTRDKSRSVLPKCSEERERLACRRIRAAVGPLSDHAAG